MMKNFKIMIARDRGRVLAGCLIAALPCCGFSVSAQAGEPDSYGIGHAVSAADIARIDIDVRPDGKGLPAGSGTVAEGRTLYAAQCAACHGETGKEGPFDVLVGRLPDEKFPFAENLEVRHTIGNYWPYATTVFDYVRRAMPMSAPGSLPDDDVYSLTAYLLFLNELFEEEAVMDAQALPKIKMPAQPWFYSDYSPSVKAASDDE